MPKTMIKLLAQKIEGLPLRIEDKARYEEFRAQLEPGCYEITIQKAKKMKSNQQVKAIFGLLINSVVTASNDEGIDTRDFLRHLINTDIPSGVGLTSDFLYQLFLTVCPITDDDGRRVTLSKMSTVQAAKFFDECRDLVATSVGIYIPDPRPDWKAKEKEQEDD